jgi:hypothetical protein
MTIMKKSFLLTLSLSLPLAACSKKDSNESAPAATATAAPAVAAKPAAAEPVAKAAAPAESELSCTAKSVSQCTDYPGGDASLVKDQCGLINGTFATASCSTAKKLGTCDFSALHKRVTYYPGGEDNLTAKTAEDACKTLNGTWQP